jgi:hypothetical protein
MTNVEQPGSAEQPSTTVPAGTTVSAAPAAQPGTTDKPSKTRAVFLGGTGLVLLAVCIAWTLIAGIPTATSAACRAHLQAKLDAAPDQDAENGNLKITGVWPDQVGIGGQLCVVITGAAAKASEAQIKQGTESNPSRPTPDITLFLNDVPTSMVLKANAVSRPQLLIYQFGEHDNATTDAAKFWRGLLAGRITDGAIELSVGISKSKSSSPEAVGPSVKLLVYRVWIAVIGAASMVSLVAAFVLFAADSMILRDSTSTVVNGRPNGTFSLGRSQMALWLGLSIAGFIFLWLTLGFYLNVITDGILVLLGINGVTGLASVLIDKPSNATASTSATSKNFFMDIISDSGGPQLHRIQMVIWTSILAIIFTYNVVCNFVFVDFDTKLLLLMGIASSTYLGFKTQEKAVTVP